MKRSALFLLFCLTTCIFAQSVKSQPRKAIKTSTDVLVLMAPAAGFIGSLVIKDYQGTKQIVLSGATSLALLPTPRLLSKELLLFKDVMAGNGERRLICYPLTSAGGARMRKNTIGGMSPAVRQSAWQALTCLPARLPGSIV